MKGYTRPEVFVIGNCFICNQPCDANAYCHFKCAEAYSEEKARRVEKAKQEIQE